MLKTAPYALALCLGAAPLVADESADTKPSSDPAAVSAVEAALDQLIADERLSFETSTQHKMKGPDFNQESTSATSVQREGDAYAVRPLGNQFAVEAISNGETLWLHLPSNGRYTEGPAPDRFAEIEYAPLIVGENPLLLAVMNPQATKDQLDQAVITNVGQEDYAGKTTDRVRVALSAETLEAAAGMPMPADLSFDAWITSDEPRRLLRVVPDLQGMLEANPGMAPEGFEVSVTMAFDEWLSPESFDPDTFAFKPPPGAEQVEDLMAEPGGPEDVLADKPAPEFELPALAGGDVSLADLKGQIVILDFWATWCPPCVEGLPKVAGVAEEYADRGVVFYAVNVREEPDAIHGFLNREGLEGLNVLLDGGDVAEAFHVGGIPQTVVIDRQGVVRAVHVGFGPGGEKQLAADLDQILAAETQTD